jgi:hypothetical protein
MRKGKMGMVLRFCNASDNKIDCMNASSTYDAKLKWSSLIELLSLHKTVCGISGYRKAGLKPRGGLQAVRRSKCVPAIILDKYRKWPSGWIIEANYLLEL